ncbi:MAG: amino acid racemase [Planctomycetota bacterium]
MSAAAKTVGVMGGLGPAATCDFFARLLHESAAKRDQDHLRLLIDCDPRIADRNLAIAGEGPSPGPALVRMAQGLERAGADFLVLVCNAAHHWESEIRAAVKIPFVSMIASTVDAALALTPKPKRIGLLAADACLRADLYGCELEKRGVASSSLSAPDQARFMDLLYRIKSEDRSDALRTEMRALALALRDGGADMIIAACTEVPLVLEGHDLRVPWVSSTDALVARTIAFARSGPA